jgi:hypothetical protein
VTISERIEAARRERRILTRVSRAAWRLEQAERERAWALVSARVEGISILTLAAAIGLSPSRVHQIVTGADLDALDAALGELRAAGWPAPEDPDCGEDTELDGRDNIAGRLSDEVSWLRECADWLRQFDGGGYPPAVSLRPSADWPERAIVAVDLTRVAAVIDRIAADLDELARARRVQDLTAAAVLPGPRVNAAGGWPSRTWSSGPSAAARDCPPPHPRSWSEPGMPGRPSDTSAARLINDPATPTIRSGHADDHPRATAHTSWLSRKLDTVAVLVARLLPAPQVDARGLAAFGVCLGLQAMVEHAGGTLSVLGEPWHGKPGLVRVPGRSELLAGLPPEFTAARYHSLYAPATEVGGGFAVTAATGEVAMAIENARAGPVGGAVPPGVDPHRHRPDRSPGHRERAAPVPGAPGGRLAG